MSVRGRRQLAIATLTFAACLAVVSWVHAEDGIEHRGLDGPSVADPLEGYWLAKDPDDELSTRSVIHIYRRSGRLYGRIVRTFDVSGREVFPVCERCPGELKGRLYSDVEFIRDLRPRGKGWADGWVIDLRPGPLQGAQASCDLTLQGDGMAVLHGYIGFRWLGRSSTWVRHPKP